MWPILLAAVFSLAIIGDRAFYIFFKADINAQTFAAQIQKLLLAGEFERAIRLCDGESGSVLPQVLKAGLVREGKGEEEIHEGMDEAVLELSPVLNRRTGYLPMIANVATLTGLLGTIQGLILAFNAVAHAPAELKQTFLANGIAVSMYTTAAGLAVAIPTIVAHALIASRTARIMDDTELYALKIAKILAARERDLQASIDSEDS